MATEYHWDDNPFARIFGVGQLGRRQRLAGENALERAEIAAGPGHARVAEARRQFDAQQRILAEAQNAWNSILAEEMAGAPGAQMGDMAPPPAVAGRALRRFLTTPQAMSMGQGLLPFANAIRDGNPPTGEAFTTSPGQIRFLPEPGAPGGRQTIHGVTVDVPSNFRAVAGLPPPGQPGPLTARQAEIISGWHTAGQTAENHFMALSQLERSLAEGSQGIDYNRFMRATGITGLSTPTQVAEAMRAQLTTMLRTAGEGPMTDEDAARFQRALPGFGLNREANKAIMDILRRNLRRVITRGDLASEALRANTPEAVSDAFEAANSPQGMLRFLSARAGRELNIPAGQQMPTTAGGVVQLALALRRGLGLSPHAPLPAWAQTYITLLNDRLSARD